MDFKLSQHVIKRIDDREISEEIINQVLQSPDQKFLGSKKKQFINQKLNLIKNCTW